MPTKANDYPLTNLMRLDVKTGKDHRVLLCM